MRAFSRRNNCKELPMHQVYERCVAALMSEEQDSPFKTITPNARLCGVISRRSRQIDVLIEDTRFSSVHGRIIVDAKHHKRKLDIEYVEAFEGKMRDVEASHGILVVSGGVTSAARRRAETAITIIIMPFEDAIEYYDWRYEPCLYRCSPERGPGWVLWSLPQITGFGPLWLMYRTGKCCACGTFHVWCGDCGSYFAIPDGRLRRCGCDDRAWGAIPESRHSGHNGKPESTWLMARRGDDYIALDRKPIGTIKYQLDEGAE